MRVCGASLTLYRSHRNTRVAAQLVYNEYIANKTHIHMNGAFCYSSGALFVLPGYF